MSLVLRPVGPFLTGAAEAPGELNLSVRLRERLFTAAAMSGEHRAALGDQLRAAFAEGDGEAAASLLVAWVQTWALASMVDEARQRWTQRPDGAALAVLVAAAEIVAQAKGWPMGADGRWPEPDVHWVMSALDGARPDAVAQHHPEDGAEALAALLNLPVIQGAPLPLPPVVSIPGEALAPRRAELCGAVARGELAAVRLTSPPPEDLPTRLAWGELHLESDLQAQLDRFGLAGLTVNEAPSLAELLSPAPPGAPGEPMRRLCDVAILPGPPSALRAGRPRPTAWLLFRGPHPPIPTIVEAGRLLQALDGQRSVAQAAQAAGLPVQQAEELAEALRGLGALTA
ncbi:MAG: hypothetical protein IPO67_17155 [Deltaproteobacteria bacterium]|nr:hypothetical protein [Deltaproteobacteria bacterium]